MLERTGEELASQNPEEDGEHEIDHRPVVPPQGNLSNAPGPKSGVDSDPQIQDDEKGQNSHKAGERAETEEISQDEKHRNREVCDQATAALPAVGLAQP